MARRMQQRTNRRRVEQAGSLSIDEHLLLDFCRRWLPFGGPRNEDIFVEFGLSSAAFAERVRRLLGSERLQDLPVGEVAALRAMVETNERCSRHCRHERNPTL